MQQWLCSSCFCGCPFFVLYPYGFKGLCYLDLWTLIDVDLGLCIQVVRDVFPVNPSPSAPPASLSNSWRDFFWFCLAGLDIQMLRPVESGFSRDLHFAAKDLQKSDAWLPVIDASWSRSALHSCYISWQFCFYWMESFSFKQYLFCVTWQYFWENNRCKTGVCSSV